MTHKGCIVVSADFIEVEALHGYRTVLWTGNAKKALATAQSRLVATITATDIVEDILEYMLEVRGNDRPLDSIPSAPQCYIDGACPKLGPLKVRPMLCCTGVGVRRA